MTVPDESPTEVLRERFLERSTSSRFVTTDLMRELLFACDWTCSVKLEVEFYHDTAAVSEELPFPAITNGSDTYSCPQYHPTKKAYFTLALQWRAGDRALQCAKEEVVHRRDLIRLHLTDRVVFELVWWERLLPVLQTSSLLRGRLQLALSNGCN